MAKNKLIKRCIALCFCQLATSVIPQVVEEVLLDGVEEVEKNELELEIDFEEKPLSDDLKNEIDNMVNSISLTDELLVDHDVLETHNEVLQELMKKENFMEEDMVSKMASEMANKMATKVASGMAEKITNNLEIKMNNDLVKKYTLEDFDNMTIKELQDIARQNKLKIKGKKVELIDRVKSFYNYNKNLV